MTPRTWNLPFNHPARLEANARQLAEIRRLEAIAKGARS